MHIVIARRFLFLGPLAAAIGGFARNAGESRLVSAARNRDRLAFDRLVSEFTPALRPFISRRVGAGDREDVLQDTWLAAWEALPRFDGGCQFRTWLFSICFHKIQDYWRREQCRPLSEGILDADGRGAYLPREFGSIEVRESIRHIWEACTPAQRELLRLYYADGLTLQEISTVLGRKLSTVKYQFYRAHETAAKLLPAGAEESICGAEVVA
jgi:RNA polymerase sigma-70 factor (ECF subfamily)